MKNLKLRYIMFILAIGVIYVASSLYISRFALTTTTYIYESEKITEPVTLVVLTDEHCNYFGKDNKRLVAQVKKQSPDCIAIVGDALNSYSEDEQFLSQLITSLSQLAPVYYTPGNHENLYLAIQNKDSHNLREEVVAAGGIYVDQNYVDMNIKGQPIRMGGLYDYVFNYARVPEEQYKQKSSYHFLQTFDHTDNFKILLTHRPESYITDDEDVGWDIDLALCGHEHGGQVRIPGIGGLYSPPLENMTSGTPRLPSTGVSAFSPQFQPSASNSSYVIDKNRVSSPILK